MKVSDYVLRVRDIELMDFMDNVQVILNNGLYEFRVVDNAPTWAAQPGESAIYVSAGTIAPNRLYFYINNTWNYIGWSASGSLSLVDADGDTGITPEYIPDEDVIRFYVAGFFMAAVNSLGFMIPAEKKTVYDGTAALTYWTWTTNTAISGYKYLQAYVNGYLRMEM